MNESIEIKKISIKELSTFAESDFFNRMDIKPISPNRVLSYINNPRSEADDFVIYMLVLDEKLVCFRTILPDIIQTNNKREKFGWLSGNFTRAEHRRKGFSKLLLQEIAKDYNNKLMYTNYAIESHFLYSDSGKFENISTRNGIRFYGAIDIKDFIKSKKDNRFYKIIIPIVNTIISTTARIKRLTFNTDRKIIVKRHSNHLPENFTQHFEPQSNLLNRGKKEFEWIFKYPWLTMDNKFDTYNYPFSFYTPDFKYHFLEVSKKDDTAWLILLERENNIKLSYYKYSDRRLAAKTIIDLCYRVKAKTLTVLDHELSRAIMSQQTPFIHHKSYNMGIYSSFPIDNATKYSYQDGDGDNIFT